MDFDYSSALPLYVQVAEQIEEAVFTGSFKEKEQIPSTTEISKRFKMNPATVLKGMNLLVTKEIIEKKRGVGMFVKEGAREKISQQKKELFYSEEITRMIQTAKSIGISEQEFIELIERGFEYGKD